MGNCGAGEQRTPPPRPDPAPAKDRDIIIRVETPLENPVTPVHERSPPPGRAPSQPPPTPPQDGRRSPDNVSVLSDGKMGIATTDGGSLANGTLRMRKVESFDLEGTRKSDLLDDTVAMSLRRGNKEESRPRLPLFPQCPLSSIMQGSGSGDQSQREMSGMSRGSTLNVASPGVPLGSIMQGSDKSQREMSGVSRGGSPLTLASPGPPARELSGNLAIAPGMSLSLNSATVMSHPGYKALATPSKAGSIHLDFFAVTAGGGEYGMKVECATPGGSFIGDRWQRQTEEVQGRWEDRGGNVWEVVGRKAKVCMKENGNVIEYELQEGKARRGEPRTLGFLCEGVFSFVLHRDWSTLSWSDGDVWQKVWDPGAQVDVYYGEEGWFKGTVEARDSETGEYTVSYADATKADGILGAHMRDREADSVDSNHLRPPKDERF